MYLAFDNRRTSQHDAVRLDGALKAAADRQFLCGDGASTSAPSEMRTMEA